MNRSFLLTIVMVFCQAAFGQSVPNLINYQGRLTAPNGARLPMGDYGIVFRLWDSATNNTGLVWGQRQNVSVQAGGVFNVVLGAPGGSAITNPISAVNDLTFAFSSANRFLGLSVVSSNGVIVSGAGEILPRQQLLSVPFAVMAQQVADGAISDRHVATLSRLTSSDGARTNALEISSVGDVHIDEDLVVDRDLIAGRLIVAGDITIGSASWYGQGLEMRTGNGAPPFIDFSNDPATDFDARIILADNDTLNVHGCNFDVRNGNAYANDFLPNSDRGLKTDFSAVNAADVLTKVVNLPIQTWRFTNEPPSVRHIGPMAQDFHEVFHLNEDDKHISSTDANGVALAAVQGLHRILQQKDAELAVLKEQMEELQKAINLLSRDSKHNKE